MMLMYKSVLVFEATSTSHLCPLPPRTQALALSGVSRLLQSRWGMLTTLDGFGRIWAKFCATLLLYGQSDYEEVSSSLGNPHSVRYFTSFFRW